MLRSNFNKVILTSLFFTSTAWSQSVSVDAHVHGEAELMIAVEGKRVEIQLLSPAANILGFEHAPSSTEQEEQVSRANTILANTESLFEFKGAACESTSQTIEVPFTNEVVAANDKEQHEHEEDHHDHADEHEDSHNESHTEVSANYVFSCDEATLTEVQAVFLTQFPDIELLEVQWITDTKQGAQELSAKQTWIDLR